MIIYVEALIHDDKMAFGFLEAGYWLLFLDYLMAMIHVFYMYLWYIYCIYMVDMMAYL